MATLSAVLMVSLSGCFGGPSSIPADSLQKDIGAKMTDTVGKPKTVSCTGDLEGTVGAETSCVVEVEDNTVDLRAQVTEVVDGQASYKLIIDDFRPTNAGQ